MLWDAEAGTRLACLCGNITIPKPITMEFLESLVSIGMALCRFGTHESPKDGNRKKSFKLKEILENCPPATLYYLEPQ